MAEAGAASRTEEWRQCASGGAGPSDLSRKKQDRAATAERAKQREVCEQLLARWLPLATSADILLQKEGRSGPVIDDEPFEAGLKAGAFVLKLLERLGKLDGLDTDEEPPEERVKPIDPVELARRVRTLAPILAAKMAAGLSPGLAKSQSKPVE